MFRKKQILRKIIEIFKKALKFNFSIVFIISRSFVYIFKRIVYFIGALIKYLNRYLSKIRFLNLNRKLLLITSLTISLCLLFFLSLLIVKNQPSTTGFLGISTGFTEPKEKTIKHQIESGQVYSQIMPLLEMNNDLSVRILEEVKDVYDLTMIRAGNEIRSIWDQDSGEFKRLEYEIDQDHYLCVELVEPQTLATKGNGEENKSEEESNIKNSGENNSENNKDNKTAIEINRDKIIQAEIKKVQYEIELDVIEGEINSSLYQTGQEIGMTDKLIIELADIFAWDIDFSFDVRVGDRFKLLYEKKFLHGEFVDTGKILAAYYLNANNPHWALNFIDQEGREDYYDLEGGSLRRVFLRSPLQYKYISSGYTGKRLHPILRIYTTHYAIDYAAPTGTPVSSVGSGSVVFKGWKRGLGHTVIIRHNQVYQTRYSHLSNYGKGVYYGAKVVQGQIIGYVGSTGYSTGPHLEYAMTKYGGPINPLLANFDKVEPVKEEFMPAFELKKQELMDLID